ncbi:class I SAM-dependent methyltransferase [Telmatospirillum siberiense]|uniref:Ubiquinone/menaquinone biosynthesis C-methyltransferase UbiE n=1 Tax=Telmatospirillum siberiense TaxID=382514 RepID=A0A2N3PMG6_9PROT|nr:class I SAM-dependent methyltransferase [Telmatospirillum siberiense]PKU21596.1 bifunctional demethylmenaquinone methyltransferase/2-methoxy-6-polyprenyl-1,4-benzoquinol methylase [Telmatospirillum siberiense]
MTKLDNSFGFSQVPPEERRDRIRHVFTAIAGHYDLMNDITSFGIHRLWKRLLVRAAGASAGQVIVDLAGGTGGVAAKMAGADRRVVVCDPSLAMMETGRQRADTAHVSWLAAEGEAIPFADGSVDTLTISFGIRNVTHLETAIAEMHRVLKPGGRLLCLEFSKPHWLIRPFYDAFSFLVIPRLGAWIAQAPEAYTYLIESIRRFPDQETMSGLFRDAGFADVRYRNLGFGIACLHIGTKAS